MPKPKSLSSQKSTSSAKPALAPLRRTNSKRFDIDPDSKQDNVISAKVSTAMKERTVAAAPMFGLRNQSEVITYALARLFNQSEEILKAHKDTGVLPMSLVAMKSFRALGPAPEEVRYAAKWMPEKVERLGTRRQEMEDTITELRARLEAVERMLKIEQLDPTKTEKKALGPMKVEIDLL